MSAGATAGRRQDKRARPAAVAYGRGMRALLVSALVALAASTMHVGTADACVRAGEANTLLGWTADGRYVLLALVAADGAVDHAEILPTAYVGSVHVVAEQGDEVVVTRVPVGTCADFGDDSAAIVERRRGRLTLDSLRGLATVAAMKFGKDEAPAAGGLPTARFTGKKRYAVHDLAITSAAGTTTVPVPVWCVGSCLRDEKWNRWRAEVVAVHALVSGAVLYETRLHGVCNGGTAIRVLAAAPPAVKVPKRRCFGSGQ